MQKRVRKPKARPKSMPMSTTKDMSTTKQQAQGAKISLKEKDLWLFGLHCVRAAINSKRRRIFELQVTENTYSTLPMQAIKERNIPIKVVTKSDLRKKIPLDAVHQGVIMRVAPLQPFSLEQMLRTISPQHPASVVILDQVTDPHNIGAILRSAAIFGAKAVIVASKNSPRETGILAKAASGALETIPYIRVPNIKRTMEVLKAVEFWCVGFSPLAVHPLHSFSPGRRTAIIMGAEGSGMRYLTEKSCDVLLSIKTPNSDSALDSLNVSNATAIALYTLCQNGSY